MNRSPLCNSGLRAALRQIHSVDKSLLLFMIVLLAQSIYSLFFPGTDGQLTGDIDIIVRTSSAAILGYFLSANFVRHTTSAGQAPAETKTHIVETEGESSASAAGPVAKIGFDTGSSVQTTGDVQMQTGTSQGEAAQTGCLQIKVATAIGLFCLLALLVLRNLSQWDLLPIQWEAASTTAAQLRDFVSGCVGFLIGCPTQSTSQSDQTP